jgi:hypothetical protein
MLALDERLILGLDIILLSACLAGLFVRRRQGLCVSFTLYLGAVLLSDTLVLLWTKFYSWDFWLLKETVHSLLKFAIALELTLRTFRAFPAARRTAAGLLLGVLLLTWLSVAFAPAAPTKVPGPPDFAKELAWKIQPYVLAGTVWLFIAISVLILWYRLPVVPLHKALLLGFVPWLLIFNVAMNLLSGGKGGIANYVKNPVYLALIAYWTLVAWRRGPPSPGGGRSSRAAAADRLAA